MALAEWKKLVTVPTTELLKPRGFRKSGLSYKARRDGVTLRVWFQSNTASTRDVLIVTCNVNLHFEVFAEPWDFDPQWRKRIGNFMPQANDHWWECSSDDEAITAGREIAEVLESRALPEMERWASPEAIMRLWESGASPGLTDWQRRTYLSRLKAAGMDAG